MGQSKPLWDSLDQHQIEMIERAIDRAWDVIRHTDPTEESEGRELLALCVLSEARAGEDNQIKLVNKAIIDYRLRRDRDKFFASNRAD
jgi:hypothetical protein